MKFAVAALSLVLSFPAAAATPTQVQLRDIEKLFAFDDIASAMVQNAFSESDDRSLPKAQSSCLQAAFRDTMDADLMKSLAAIFHDGETADAWLRFGNTAGGAKIVRILHDTSMAAVAHTSAPDIKAELAAFTPAENNDFRSFMATPAKSVLDDIGGVFESPRFTPQEHQATVNACANPKR